MLPEVLHPLRERVKPGVRTAARHLLPLLFRGDRVGCPCCGGRFRRFMQHADRKGARCPACLSLERHRLLWLFFDQTSMLSGEASVLHFAPEIAIQENLRAMPDLHYVSADLGSASSAELRADITDIPFEDDSFDLAICNHVLEHVSDDRGAMRELHRVLKPTGIAVMQHPLDPRRAATFEDASVTSPRERLRVFGQRDHVRIYGRDFPDRLREAGFDVDIRDYYRELDRSIVVRYGLADEPIYLCAKARAGSISDVSELDGQAT